MMNYFEIGELVDHHNRVCRINSIHLFGDLKYYVIIDQITLDKYICCENFIDKIKSNFNNIL